MSAVISTASSRSQNFALKIMSARLTNNPDFDSNNETDDVTIMFSSEDETSDEEISQQLTPKTCFQKEFGEARR